MLPAVSPPDHVPSHLSLEFPHVECHDRPRAHLAAPRRSLSRIAARAEAQTEPRAFGFDPRAGRHPVRPRPARTPLAARRPVPRRSRGGGGGRPGSPADLLLRSCGWRCVEDDQRRRDVAQRERRHVRHRVGRRDRGGPVRPQCGLRGRGRGGLAGRPDTRRWHVAIDRRRRNVASPRTRRYAPHCRGPRRPDQSGHRLRRRHGARVRTERRTRRVPLERRGEELDEGAVRRRFHRRDRSRARSVQRTHPVRRAVEESALPLGLRRRRRPERALEEHRRRRHLDGYHRESRPAAPPSGSHRRHRVSRQPVAIVGQRGSAGLDGRDFPLRRRGQELGAGQRRPKVHDSPVVLLVRHRRPDGREYGLRPEPRHLAIGRRGRDVFAHSRAARRLPRPVDRSGQPQAHDRGKRRRRNCLVRRRGDLVDPVQPADRTILSRHYGRSVSVPHLRRAAGQHHRLDRQSLR